MIAAEGISLQRVALPRYLRARSARESLDATVEDANRNLEIHFELATEIDVNTSAHDRGQISLRRLAAIATAGRPKRRHGQL